MDQERSLHGDYRAGTHARGREAGRGGGGSVLRRGEIG